MKVISLMQPYAQLVVIGAKKFETRKWNTFHRGKILIHASQSKEYANFSFLEPFEKYIKGLHGFYKLPFGAIIGECKIDYTDSTENIRKKLTDQRQFEEIQFGDYSTGRMAWHLVQPIMYKIAIPCKGSLSIWDCPAVVEQQILKQSLIK